MFLYCLSRYYDSIYLIFRDPSPDDNDSEKKEMEMAEDANCESEWIANDIEMDDDPIEEGQEMFSSDED